MGATGPNFRCPWCGRRNTVGCAIDGIDYPICSGVPLHSCMDAVLEGTSMNGVRAGALYRILMRDVRFQRVHGAQSEFFLQISDLLFGMDCPGETRGNRWRNDRGMRLFYWEQRYVYRTIPTTHPRGMLR